MVESEQVSYTARCELQSCALGRSAGVAGCPLRRELLEEGVLKRDTSAYDNRGAGGSGQRDGITSYPMRRSSGIYASYNKVGRPAGGCNRGARSGAYHPAPTACWRLSVCLGRLPGRPRHSYNLAATLQRGKAATRQRCDSRVTLSQMIISGRRTRRWRIQ